MNYVNCKRDYFIAISIFMWSENLSILGFQLHRPTPRQILFIDIVTTDIHKYEHFHSSRWTLSRCRSQSEWAIISIRDFVWCMEKVLHIIHVVHWMFCFRERNDRLFTIYIKQMFRYVRAHYIILVKLLLKLHSNFTSRQHEYVIYRCF